MIKLMTHFLVLLVFTTFGYASTYYDRDTGDVQAVLQNPKAALKKDSSFAAQVTKPFAENPKQDLSFFSDPKKSRPQWDQKYKDWTKKTNNPTAFEIFEMMGTSHRGILNNADQKYTSIADAQKTGMLSIASGSLGLKKDKSLTKDEEAIAARELLTIGHSMENDALFNAELGKLEQAHKVATLTPKQKRHLQISALYMLTGHQSEIKTEQWYTKGLQGLDTLQRKIKVYAERFLPKAEPKALEPKDVVIRRLLYGKDLQNHLWGTSGIKASGLNAGLEAKFPNTMILGSYGVPKRHNFSITAEVSPNHYFVVMVPEVRDRNPVLRPQYMVNAEDQISGEGKGTTKATIFYQGKQAQDLAIKWEVTKGSEGIKGKSKKTLSKVEPTEQRDNDGQVTCIPEDVIQTNSTYSFIAQAGDKKFYYLRPESAQIDALRESFAANRKFFTFGELYDYLREMDSSIEVGKGILSDIQKIMNGTLENFSH